MEKIKILIFENDFYLSEIYGLKFQMAGFEVKVYEFPPENLADEVAKEKPAIISMDIIMPKMDGFEATKILKEDQRTKNIPIIGFDNLEGKEYTKKALEIGMEKYFIKANTSPQKYVNSIIEVLKEKGYNVESLKENASAEISKNNSTETKYDLSKLKQLLKIEDAEEEKPLNENSNINHKTISYLNSKVWYRFLKVIYILLSIVILLGYNFIIFSTVGLRNLDKNKTLIQCNVGTYKIFTPESIKLNLDKKDFTNEQFDYANFFQGYYNDYKIRNILTECASKRPSDWKDDDVFVIQRTYEITGVKGTEKTYDKNYLDSEIKKITSGYKTNQEKAGYLDFSIKFFDIKPIFTYDAFIQYFVIGNLIILFVFEIFKRIFYYISLGSLFPKK